MKCRIISIPTPLPLAFLFSSSPEPVTQSILLIVDFATAIGAGIEYRYVITLWRSEVIVPRLDIEYLAREHSLWLVIFLIFHIRLSSFRHSFNNIFSIPFVWELLSISIQQVLNHTF